MMARGTDAYSKTAASIARDELIVEHLWLVRHIAGRLTVRMSAGISLEDLESAGMLGLVEAAGRFDASKGVLFRTFASTRIRGAMLDELRRNCPLPQEMLQKVSLVRGAQQQLPPPVSVQTLVAETGLSQEQVIDCLAAMPLIDVKSLSALQNASQTSRDDQPDEIVQKSDRARLVAEAIASLPGREQQVVTLYYTEDLRLKEIGKILHLSESRISRILTSSQFQIREYVRARQ